jgi:adenine deaminase
VSAVITRREDRPLGPGDLHGALVDRAGRWVAPGVVAGFAERVDGLATTLSTDFNILVLGRAPAAMARAVNRLLDRRGGIVVVDGEQIVYEHALPIGGIMGRGSLADAAAAERLLRETLAARGHAHHDPLFSLLFLSADFLPAIRLSPRGVWDVRAAKVLLSARRRTG